MDNIWLQILKDALNGLVQRTDGPIAGAKLRAAVKKLAEDRGAQFPPEGMGKWSAFLDSFPDDITVIPNPGSDVLVVPANRLDLRAKADQAAPPPKYVRLRSDIFDALTRIPNADERTYYLPETDAVIWQRGQESVPANAVPFPQSTVQSEVDVRREFIARGNDIAEMAKSALLAALDSQGPLRQFTDGIRSYGLIQDWHNFRMESLVKRLRDWATAHALPFKDEWVGGAESRVGVTQATVLAAVTAGSKRGLVELAGQLTEEDISRISIPLDIVLRLLTPR